MLGDEMSENERCFPGTLGSAAAVNARGCLEGRAWNGFIDAKTSPGFRGRISPQITPASPEMAMGSGCVTWVKVSANIQKQECPLRTASHFQTAGFSCTTLCCLQESDRRDENGSRMLSGIVLAAEGLLHHLLHHLLHSLLLHHPLLHPLLHYLLHSGASSKETPLQLRRNAH